MSTKVKELSKGEFGIIIANGDNSCSQIALTENQSVLFKAFLQMLSKDTPLIKLSEEYDLVLRTSKMVRPIG